MIPFRSFMLPKIHASISRGGLLEHTLDPDLESLFGGSPKPEPASPIEYLNHPHTKIKNDEFFTRDHEDIASRLTPHYQFANPEHEDIIRRYTGTHHTDPDCGGDYRNAFRYINARILGMPAHKIIPSDDHNMKTFDSALHAYHTPHELTVYSGLSENHGKIVASNDRVHHPAYLSTSINPGLATSFASLDYHGSTGYGHVLKIHVPQGHPGAFVEHISRHPHENEFILPRDTTLRIDHSKRQLVSTGPSYHYFIHHAYPETK